MKYKYKYIVEYSHGNQYSVSDPLATTQLLKEFLDMLIDKDWYFHSVGRTYDDNEPLKALREESDNGKI